MVKKTKKVGLWRRIANMLFPTPKPSESVTVKAFRRKNGTIVKGYTRSGPNKEAKRTPKPQLALPPATAADNHIEPAVMVPLIQDESKEVKN